MKVIIIELLPELSSALFVLKSDYYKKFTSSPVSFIRKNTSSSPAACFWRSRCPAAAPASAGGTSRWSSPPRTGQRGRGAPPAGGDRWSAGARLPLSSPGWVSWNRRRKLCHPAQRPGAPPGLRGSGVPRWRRASRSPADTWPPRRQRWRRVST